MSPSLALLLVFASTPEAELARTEAEPLEAVEASTTAGGLVDLGPSDEDELLDTTADEDLVAIDTGTVSETLDEEWSPIFGSSDPPRFDIPISDHPMVERWVKHFQGRGRERFLRWLGRSTLVTPTYYPVLEAAGLPKDTLFLSMIESGFSTRAYSWAHAAGPWQFMPATGRRYGLTFDFWVDERRDVEASTVAAARYLARLYSEFGDWHLAWAAYNAGEARVRRAIRRVGTEDFWRIADTRALPRETKQYVPKLIAAAKVAKQLERYGLPAAEFEAPPVTETFTVTVATDLATIARACGGDVTEDELVGLNPALYRKVTPPGRAWEVRVPRFWGRDCAEGLAATSAAERLTYRVHVMGAKDTAETLARRYRTSVAAILERNRIAADQLSKFEAIVVPLPLAVSDEVPVEELPARWNRAAPYTPDSPAVRVHRVRSGDSLWRIANRYRVGVSQLKAWNGLWRRRYLRIGERIVIRGRGD
jgi:membrane-bound lytic murein transglycosylase D